MTKIWFEIDLQYNPDAPPVHENGKVGEYIGSGYGRVEGDQFQGDVHWTLYEEVSAAFCRSHLFGVITTPDSAEIRFDSSGYFLVPDSEQPHQWHTSAAVFFETEDKRYAWLNRKLAAWQGTFDMQAYRHHYRVFQEQDE